VKSDGDCNREAQGNILQTCEKRCEALGKIVNGNGKCGEEPHTHEFCVRGFVIVNAERNALCAMVQSIIRKSGRGIMERRCFFLRVCLVRIFTRGDQVVYDTNQKYAAKKRCGIDPMTPVITILPGKRYRTFDKNFNEGYVEHDTCGKPCSNRKEAIIGSLCGESDDASDAGCHTGKQGKSQRYPRFIHDTFTEQSFVNQRSAISLP